MARCGASAAWTRSIPIPPVLVQILRAHLKRYGTSPDGRIFRTARGGIIHDSAYNAYSADWAAARAAALTPAQHASRWPAAPTTCATPPSPCG